MASFMPVNKRCRNCGEVYEDNLTATASGNHYCILKGVSATTLDVVVLIDDCTSTYPEINDEPEKKKEKAVNPFLERKKHYGTDRWQRKGRNQ